MTLDYIDTVEPLSSDPFLNFHQSELCGCINMLSYFIAYTSLPKNLGTLGKYVPFCICVSLFFQFYYKHFLIANIVKVIAKK